MDACALPRGAARQGDAVRGYPIPLDWRGRGGAGHGLVFVGFLVLVLPYSFVALPLVLSHDLKTSSSQVKTYIVPQKVANGFPIRTRLVPYEQFLLLFRSPPPNLSLSENFDRHAFGLIGELNGAVGLISHVQWIAKANWSG